LAVTLLACAPARPAPAPRPAPTPLPAPTPASGSVDGAPGPLEEAMSWHATDWKPRRAGEWQALDSPACPVSARPGAACDTERATCAYQGHLIICGRPSDLCDAFCLADCGGRKAKACP